MNLARAIGGAVAVIALCIACFVLGHHAGDGSCHCGDGTANAAAIHKRRVMSASSGLGPAAAAGSVGSSAMPQIGQLPGPSRTTSGCIGHVYSIFSLAEDGDGVGAGFLSDPI